MPDAVPQGTAGWALAQAKAAFPSLCSMQTFPGKAVFTDAGSLPKAFRQSCFSIWHRGEAGGAFRGLQVPAPSSPACEDHACRNRRTIRCAVPMIFRITAGVGIKQGLTGCGRCHIVLRNGDGEFTHSRITAGTACRLLQKGLSALCQGSARTSASLLILRSQRRDTRSADGGSEGLCPEDHNGGLLCQSDRQARNQTCSPKCPLSVQPVFQSQRLRAIRLTRLPYRHYPRTRW